MNDNISRYGALFDQAAAAFSAAGSTALAANGMGSTPTTTFGEYVALFMEQMQMISVKQILGWRVIVTLFFFLLLLFHDMPARRELRKFPTWETIKRQMLHRQAH